MNQTIRIRTALASGAGVLLLLAAALTEPDAAAGQAAVPLSRPGQEDISFWVNHNGLVQYDVEGEVGFGDAARILLRRRANTVLLQELRDRFTFRVKEPAALDLPDVFRADYASGTLQWRSAPQTRFLASASRTFNVPVIVENRDPGVLKIAATYKGPTMESSAGEVIVPGGEARVLFLRAVETKSGAADGKLALRHAGGELTAAVNFDVRPLVPLRVRIVDENGRPAVARMYLTGSDGLSYAPAGSVNRITAMSAEYFFHAENSFEIELPEGETLIEATRGPEYRLSTRRVTLRSGEPASVTMRLTRWTNMANAGYWSADAHIHANYTSPHHQVITPGDVRLMTQGEDLNYANMMVANSGGAYIHDRQWFEGKPHRLSSPRHLIYWNEENRSSAFGHMCFLGLTKLVEPFYNGFRDTPHWEDYPANFPLAEQVYQQGGAVSYAHPGMAANFDAASIKEMPVDLALGHQTALDVLSNSDESATTEMWYRLLNCGFRVPVSAGTDAFTNVTDHYIAGGGRVYVYTGGLFDLRAWIEGFRAGRSFASNGPVLQFQVNRVSAGGELALNGPETVAIEANVRSQVPLDRADIIVNGRVVHSVPMTGREHLRISHPLKLEGSAWVALRALGPRHRLILNDTAAFAHSSPVYVTVAKRPVRIAEDIRFYRDWVTRLIERTEARGRFENPERKQEVLSLFRKARSWYQTAAVEH